ncbi:MAG: peptidylprolyl isomerase [Nitrospinales bacterium]
MAESESAKESKPAIPVIKPRKKFVAKKAVFKTDQPLERRVRHIRLSSREAAELVRQTILDFQKTLAEKPMDDPDKEFLDQQKVENFFDRLAKKYSACPSRVLGGDLSWISNNMEIHDKNVLNQTLIDAIGKTEKHKIPKPVQTPLGHHILLTCELRPLKKKAVKKTERTIVDDIHKDAVRGEHPKTWESDVAPN